MRIAVTAKRPGSAKVRARLSATARVPANARRTIVIRRAARRLRGVKRAALTVVVRVGSTTLARRGVTLRVRR